MKLSLVSRIDAPPQAVFAIMADIPRWHQVFAKIESIEMLTSGPVAVGTRFRETRTMFGKSATEEMTVAELVPSHRLVLTAFSHGTAYRTERIVEPSAGGSTMMLDFEGRPMSLFARLMTPVGWLFLGHVKKQIAADLEDLKRAAEQPSQAKH